MMTTSSIGGIRWGYSRLSGSLANETQSPATNSKRRSLFARIAVKARPSKICSQDQLSNLGDPRRSLCKASNKHKCWSTFANRRRWSCWFKQHYRMLSPSFAQTTLTPTTVNKWKVQSAKQPMTDPTSIYKLLIIIIVMTFHPTSWWVWLQNNSHNKPPDFHAPQPPCGDRQDLWK